MVDRLNKTVSVSFCQSFGGTSRTDSVKDASAFTEEALRHKRRRT